MAINVEKTYNSRVILHIIVSLIYVLDKRSPWCDERPSGRDYKGLDDESSLTISSPSNHREASSFTITSSHIIPFCGFCDFCVTFLK